MSRRYAITLLTCLSFAGLRPIPTLAQREPLPVEGAILAPVQAAMVPSEAAGPIVEVLVEPGDQVRKGDLLGRIRSTEIELKLGRAQMELESARERSRNDLDLQLARKSKELADKELERAESANRAFSRTVSLLEIDRLTLLAEKSRLDVLREELKLKLNELDLRLFASDVERNQFQFSQTSIRAPIDGRIASIERQEGEWVEAGADFIRVIDTSLLRVEGLIPATPDNLKLTGHQAHIRVPTGDGDFLEREGVVVFVALEANPVSSKVAVWIEFDNADEKLTPGLRVEASIEVRRE